MTHSSLNDLFEHGLLWQADPSTGSGQGPSTSSGQSQPFVERPYMPGKEKAKSTVPFGVKEIDALLPFNGLLRGGLHEFFCEDFNNAKAAKSAKEKTNTLYILPSWIAAQALLKSAPLLTAENSPEEITAGKLLIWIGRNTWPTPFLLEQLGKALTVNSPELAGDKPKEVNILASSFFADPPDRKLKLWAIEAALRSSATAAVITECDRMNFKLTQRLTLAAEEGLSLAIIMRPLKERETPSAALTRWLISPVTAELDESSALKQPAKKSGRQAELPLPAMRGAWSSPFPRWKIELLKCRGRQPPVTSWIVELQDEEKFSLHIPADVGNRSAKAGKSRVA